MATDHVPPASELARRYSGLWIAPASPNVAGAEHAETVIVELDEHPFFVATLFCFQTPGPGPDDLIRSPRPLWTLLPADD